MGAATRRECRILDLKDDPALIAAYRDWHRSGQPPAAVTRSIRQAGIMEMEIFLSGNRLVMIMDVGPDFDPAAKDLADRGDPDVQAWEKLMDLYQQPVPWAGNQKWAAAKSIYRLSDQP
jgi:L-rhamnose mutarotase